MELLLPRVKAPVLKPPSYLKLDMAFGVGAGATLFDKSRYRSHGTIHGADWAAGAHGYCLNFDSSVPDYVEIPAAHTQLDFTSEDFSIIMRIYPHAFAGGRALFERGSLMVDGYLFMLSSNGDLYVYISQSGEFQDNHSVPNRATLNAWNTVGMSRDGTRVYLFINGIDVTVTTTAITNPATCTRSAKIAVRDDKSTAPYDGLIEFLRIFGGIALSASEHLAWHNALA